MQNSHTQAVLLLDYVSKCMQTLQNTDGVIKNGQSWETGSIGYLSWRKTKHKHNTTCVGHHYPQANTTNIRRELFYKQLEVKLNRTFQPEIVTDITIHQKTEGGLSSTSVFVWNTCLPIRFNTLFKACTRDYCKDLVNTNYYECGDLI